MNKYKHSINVQGEFEDLVKLGNELENLGYRPGFHSTKDGKAAMGINGSSRFPNEENGIYAVYGAACTREFDFVLKSNDRAQVDAILGIAAIQNTEDNEFAVGELVWILGAGGWGYSPDNNGCIGQVLELGPRRERNDKLTTQEIVFKTLNPRRRDQYVDRASVPNNTKERRIFRKLTPSEILKYYKVNSPLHNMELGEGTYVSGYNWCAPIPSGIYPNPHRLLKLTPNPDKSTNMNKKIIGYQTKYSFPGILLDQILIPTADGSIRHKTCSGIEYVFTNTSLQNKELFEPVYEEDKTVELANIGSRKLVVRVGKESAEVGSYGKVKIAQIQQLWTIFMNLPLASIGIDGKPYSVSMDLDTQFIRIGCSGDNNRFSINELKKVLEAAGIVKHR